MSVMAFLPPSEGNNLEVKRAGVSDQRNGRFSERAGAGGVSGVRPIMTGAVIFLQNCA